MTLVDSTPEPRAGKPVVVEAPPPAPLDRRGSAPAARYSDPGWYAREQAQVFDRAWLMAGLAFRVAAPGQYFTFDELGRSVVVLRDAKGTLRAFHNACRHRGTRLLDGCGAAKAIRCPYHDWKYALDGRLRHVPDAEGFDPPIDKGAMGLRPVRVAEAMGMVWLSFDDDAPPLDGWLGDIVDQVAPYDLTTMRPIQETAWIQDCNWKAVIDNATEAYHIDAVHGGTVGAHRTEQPEILPLGDHCRMTLAISDYGWRRAVDRWTSRGGPYTERQRAALFKYRLFPNLIVNLVPCHLTVFQVWPLDARRCRFFYGFYGREGARPLEWLRARATWLLSRYILLEDQRILERFQQGADVAHGDHRFHAGEGAIDHFHRVLDRWVEG